MHPFVRNDTVLNYNGMQLATAEKLTYLCQGQKRPPVSHQLYNRIRSGAHASKETPRKFKKFIPLSA